MVSHTKSDQGGGVNNSMRFSDLGSHGIPLQQSIRLAIGEIIVTPVSLIVRRYEKEKEKAAWL